MFSQLTEWQALLFILFALYGTWCLISRVWKAYRAALITREPITAMNLNLEIVPTTYFWHACAGCTWLEFWDDVERTQREARLVTILPTQSSAGDGWITVWENKETR